MPSPTARWTHRDTSRLQIPRRSFSPDLSGFLDAPQRPAQPAQRDDLLFLFFAQDIHRRRVNPPLQSMSWSAIPLAAFQVSTDGRFWVSPEAR
jgi:hypothetical protein